MTRALAHSTWTSRIDIEVLSESLRREPAAAQQSLTIGALRLGSTHDEFRVKRARCLDAFEDVDHVARGHA